jgi:serine protease Do
MRPGHCAAMFALTAWLAACQTAGGAPDARLYHPFSTPADHVEELVKAGELDRASEFWTDQTAYFTDDPRGSTRRVTALLEAALLQRLAPRFLAEARAVDAVAWPAPRPDWPGIREVMRPAEALKSDLDRHAILKLSASAERDRFLSALEAKLAAMRADAPGHFRFGDAAFLQDYPVALDRKALVRATRPAWRAAAAEASSGEILDFHARYGDAFDGEDRIELARLHFRARLRGGAGADRLLVAVEETRKAGLPVESLVRAGVQLVEITDQRALIGRPDAFPLRLDGSKTPFPVKQLSLDGLKDDPDVAAAEIVVIVDGVSARSERRDVRRETIAAAYQADTKDERNPDYRRARDDVAAARFRLAEARRAFARQLDACRVDCRNPALYRYSEVPEAEYEYAAALRALEDTPSHLSSPVYVPYQVTRSVVEVAKKARAAVHIVDRRRRTLGSGVIDIDTGKTFFVIGGVRPGDRDPRRAVGSDTEMDIAEYLRGPEKVAISEVFGTGAGLRTRPLPATVDLSQLIAEERRASP